VLLATEEFNKDSANANVTIKADIPNIAKAGCCKPKDVKEMLAKVRNSGLLERLKENNKSNMQNANKQAYKNGATTKQVRRAHTHKHTRTV